MPTRTQPRPDTALVPTSTPGAGALRRVPNYEPAHERSCPAPAVGTSAGPRRPPARASMSPEPTPVNPAAQVRAQQVFRLTFEVLAGLRGPQQLHALMAPDLVAKVTTLARDCAGQRARSTARLHRVHVQQVTPRAAEACVTVAHNGRIQAVAARMELGKYGWRCTALRII